jgi:hypothetical protein
VRETYRNGKLLGAFALIELRMMTLTRNVVSRGARRRFAPTTSVSRPSPERTTYSRIEKPRAVRYDVFGALKFPMNPNGWCRDWITSRQVPVTPSGGARSGESARDVASSGTVAFPLLSREGRARIAEGRSGGSSSAGGSRTAGSCPSGNPRSGEGRPRSRPPKRAVRMGPHRPGNGR